MIRAYSMLTTKQEAVTIYFDQERGELCRNPHADEDGVKWERYRASNPLAAFAVEKMHNAEIRGDYRNDTLKKLALSENDIENNITENLQKP